MVYIEGRDKLQANIMLEVERSMAAVLMEMAPTEGHGRRLLSSFLAWPSPYDGVVAMKVWKWQMKLLWRMKMMIPGG